MNGRNSGIFGLLVVFLLGILSQASADAPTDALWGRAVSLAGANLDWAPGLTVVTFDELDRKGWVTNSMQSRTTAILGEDGKVETHTEGEQFARRAGPDGAAAPGDRRAWLSDGVFNPFRPEVQPGISVHPSGDAEKVSGHQCIPYEFELADGEGQKLTGTAWLEQSTGVPVKLLATPSPLPQGVRRMQIETHYTHEEGGAWYPAVTFVEQRIVRYVVIVKRFRITMKFGGYFRLGERVQGE